MVKALVQIIFGCDFFICQPIFKGFAAILGLLECKRMESSHFVGCVSGKGNMQKAVSKGWCKESSLNIVQVLTHLSMTLKYKCIPNTMFSEVPALSVHC